MAENYIKSDKLQTNQISSNEVSQIIVGNKLAYNPNYIEFDYNEIPSKAGILSLISTSNNYKFPVRAVATNNIILSGESQQIDGGGWTVGNDILVTNQNVLAENGIYTIQTGAWIRRYDALTQIDLISASVFVTDGQKYAGSFWYSKNGENWQERRTNRKEIVTVPSTGDINSFYTLSWANSGRDQIFGDFGSFVVLQKNGSVYVKSEVQYDLTTVANAYGGIGAEQYNFYLSGIESIIIIS